MTTKVKNDALGGTAVKLVEGKFKIAGGKHDYYWHIYANGIRAGQVYIDYSDDEILGRHASIHIFLNKKSQGKKIGRIGYSEACRLSQLDIIYAHMRKNNIASKRAAEAAGFKQVLNPKFLQLVLIWKSEILKTW